jgi:monoamine oxidase
MYALIEGMKEGLEVKYNQRARLIRQHDSQVTVSTMTDDFEGDVVLVTVPLGVLQAGDIRFDPEISTAKRNAIQKLGVGHSNRLVMQFESAFWPTDRDFLGLMGKRRAEHFWFSNHFQEGKKPILVAHLGDEFSRKMAGRDANGIAEYLMPVLKKSFPSIPTPSELLFSGWERDKQSRGAFSYLPNGIDIASRDYLARSEKRLYFAGEATVREGSGTMLGAFQSGLRAANWIIG